MSAFALSFLNELWSVWREMAPYLLFGFFVAGLISLFLSPALVARHLGGRGMGPVFKAALFGVPLPLCSCGVIPVAASLRRGGASRAATTSFLLSTPQTGVDSILVTFSLLGAVFAIFRPLVALFCGVFGGFLVGRFAESEESNTPSMDSSGARTDEGKSCCDKRLPENDGNHLGPDAQATGENNQNCQDVGHWGRRLADALEHGLVVLPRDIGKPLVLGVFVAAAISILAPREIFSGTLGHGLLGMLLMMAFGIPLYVCATASTPIAAALIAAGVSPGAALVFLMTGPATNAATITTIWKTMGRKTAFLYLFTVAVSALGAGFLLDAIYPPAAAAMHHHGHAMIPGAAQTACAVALIAMIAHALARARLHTAWTAWRNSRRETTMDTIRLHVTGMSCMHCVDNVRKALARCAGVESVDVNLAAESATIRGVGIDETRLRRAIVDAGYGADKA